jgi:hypothetical protein
MTPGRFIPLTVSLLVLFAVVLSNKVHAEEATSGEWVFKAAPYFWLYPVLAKL